MTPTTTPVLQERTGHQHETVEVWAVPSATTAVTYTVTVIGNVAGLQHRCTCRAGQYGRRCHHVAAVEAVADQPVRPTATVISGLSAHDVTIDDLWGRKSAA